MKVRLCEFIANLPRIDCDVTAPSVESIGITRSDRADLLIPSADELYPTNPDLLVFVPSDNEVYIGRRQLKMILYD